MNPLFVLFTLPFFVIVILVISFKLIIEQCIIKADELYEQNK